MRSHLHHAITGLVLAALLISGCAGPNAERQYLFSERDCDDDVNDLQYYKDRSTAIEYPIEQCPQPTDPALFMAPRNIRSHEEVPPQRLTLDDAVRMALQNSEVLLEDATFGSPGNPLLSSPDRVTSIYDTAIQETGFLFGNRGPEAALSEFDALFTTNLAWGRTEDPQNSQFLGLGTGSTLTEETGTLSTRLEKPLANSGTVSLQHDVSYSGNNVPPGNRLFQSAFSGFLRAEYRQPLWAGSGTEYTRIAGPLSQQLRGVSGVSQGVLISRINTDISLTQFEQTVASVVRDVEQRYWDLYLALQLYESESETLKDTQRFWLQIKGRQESLVAESQARNNLLENEARVKGTLADVLEAEARLRRLLKLPLNDGTFLTPVDVPAESRLVPDWQASLTEALVYRPELRRQKWNIRSLELQLRAARNVNNPRLDFVTNYSRNMLGDNLFGEEDDDGVTSQGYASAYETLTQGLNDSWNIGFQFTMPVGLRIAHAQVQNYEWRLRKARAVLAEQERDVAYELSAAMLGMQRWYELAESSVKRISSSREYARAAFERSRREDITRPESLSLALSARLGQRDAEQAYVRSVVEYNKAITDFQFRQGTLLNQSNIRLAEGEWNQEAQRQALKRAVDRTRALDNHKLQTEPLEFVAASPFSVCPTGPVTSPISGQELNTFPPPVPPEIPESSPEATPDAASEADTAPPVPTREVLPDPNPQQELTEPRTVPSDRVLTSRPAATPIPTRGVSRFGTVGSDAAVKPVATSGRVRLSGFAAPVRQGPGQQTAPSDRVVSPYPKASPVSTRGVSRFGSAGSDAAVKPVATSGRVSFSAPPGESMAEPKIPQAGTSETPPRSNSKARVRLPAKSLQTKDSAVPTSANVRLPNDVTPPSIPKRPRQSQSRPQLTGTAQPERTAPPAASRGRIVLAETAPRKAATDKEADSKAEPATGEAEDVTLGRAIFSPTMDQERDLQRMMRSVEKYEESRSGRFRLGSLLPNSDRKGRVALGE